MGAAPVLTILRNGETLKSFPIESEALLGRGEGCVIRLDDRAISRQHAIFRRTADGVQLEKRSEFGPILLNGAECTSAIIKDGDVINIGPYLMKMAISKDAMVNFGAPPQSDAVMMPALSPTQVENIPESTALEGATGAMTLDAAQVTPDVAVEAAGEFEQPGEPAIEPALDSSMTSPNMGGLEVDAGDGALAIESSETPGAEVASDSGTGVMVDENASTKLISAAKIEVQLVFPAGAANHTTFSIDKDEVSIGRGKSCDIILNDKRSSRKNTVIQRAGGAFVIRDLNSSNGTYVNGARITEQQLSGDDKIRIGDVEFEFKAASSDYAAREKDFLKVPEESAASDVPDFDIQLPAPVAATGEIPVLPADMAMGGAVGAPQLTPGIEQQAGIVPDFAGGVLGGIPGLGLPEAGKPARVSLIQKYRDLPPARKLIWTVIILALVWWVLEEDEAPKKQPQKKPGISKKAKDAGVRTFEMLTPEEQQLVERQRQAAFDYLTIKRDYDEALNALQPIYKLGIRSYKNVEDIERYARQAKERQEQMKREEEAKETERRNKAQVASLIEEIRDLMQKKKYAEARDLFAKVLALDPDNTAISGWKKEIEDFDERRRIEEQQAQVQKEINFRAWEFVKEAKGFYAKGKYYSAIDTAAKVKEISATDKKVLAQAASVIQQAKEAIQSKRDPLLQEAKQFEDSGDFAKAYQLYLQAQKIDPRHPASYKGIERVRGVLHERARVLYTEAVLAESYSDFSTAKKKFQECLGTAPVDDIYHQRSERKLARFLRKDDQ